MAAPRRLQLLLPLRGGRRSLHSASPPAAGADVASAPRARYPPVVASLTADSGAARRRRLERWQAAVHAAAPGAARLRLFTKLQRPKFAVPPQTFALRADRCYQALTKTAFRAGLPAAPARPAAPDLGALRAAARDCLLQEHCFRSRRPRPPRARAAAVLDQLVPALAALLSPHNPVLAAAALDYKRPVHFYWLRGEEVVPSGHRKGRVDPVRYQIDDKPHTQIRIPRQLPEFVPLDYSPPQEIPVMTSKPDKLPLFKRQYENNIFTGSKTEDPCCYGHTQFHLLPDRLARERLLRRNCADQVEVVYRANAIASLFAWTGAQAMYQGFWSEADVTRPFVSQCVITDGRYFAFFCYQLNTLALTTQADENNPRKNICWGTESRPLYESIEDGDVKGFSDDVLLDIVHFLLNRPKEEKPQLLEN